jgi:hypothetical protein
MPLDRPVAPRFTDGAFDRAQILTEFPHEPLEGLIFVVSARISQRRSVGTVPTRKMVRKRKTNRRIVVNPGHRSFNASTVCTWRVLSSGRG